MHAGTDKLTALLAPVAEGLGFEWVGVEIINQSGDALARMYIDKPGGVSIDDCVQAAEQFIAVLTVEGLNQAYRVEVSSPGLDRPLFTKAHWEKAKGLEVRVKLRYPVSERRQVTGVIHTVGDEAVEMIVDSARFDVPFDAVAKANLIPVVDFKSSKKRQ